MSVPLLFLLAVAFISYTYFGYGLILRFLVRRRVEKRPEVLSDEECPPVVVIISAHNEEGRIGRKIDNCLALDYPAEMLRVLVVSDGSADGTAAVVAGYDSSRVGLLEREHRAGKASAINLAMSTIEEEFAIMADVRQRLAPDVARVLVSHFADPKIGAVTGELRLEELEPASTTGFGMGVSTYWSQEVEIRRNEAAVHSSVGVTGAIYALRRSAFQPINGNAILDDVLIPMNAVMSGFRVAFDATALAFDAPPRDVAAEQRRKVRTMAGNFQLLALKPQLLSPTKNPIFWQFLSHKVFRLIVPLAMLLAFVCCLLLSKGSWFWTGLLLFQLAAYGVSVLPERTMKRLPLRPVSIIRTFVLMHWFVVLGFCEYVTNRNAHLWRVSS